LPPYGTVVITNCKAIQQLGNSLAPVGTQPVTAQLGASEAFKGIPYYTKRINEFVRTFAQAINAGQSRNGNQQPLALGLQGFNQGTDLYGNLGANFFNVNTQIDPASGLPIAMYNQITAATFTVNNEVLNDPSRLGVAKSVNPDVSDNLIAQDILQIKHLTSLFNEGEVGNYLQAVIGEIGVDAKQAANFQDNYNDITMAVNNQRLSVMGVSLDEEVSNMVKYQQAYNAAAKLISIIDAVYNTTINGLGI